MKKHLILFTAAILFFVHHVSAQAGSNGFSSVVVSAQWNQAVGLAFNKAGTQMFVWERTGKVWVVENNAKTLVLDITEEVGAYGDLGLLGFTLDPQFDNNGYFYLLYTVDRHYLLDYGTSRYDPTVSYNYTATIHRLTRFTATKTSSGYTVNPASRLMLIGATRTTGIPSISPQHGPGSLLFGTDGTLLVCAGDGASASATDTGSAPDTYYQLALSNGIITQQENVGAFRSQMLESYDGKILRIDPATGNGVPSNPFYDATKPGSPRSKVWALGLRNPFRMTLKPGTGSTNPADGRPGTLYLGDVGHLTREELDVVDKGGLNLGWPLYEGLTAHANYPSKNVYNYYAPNPAYGTGGCTQQYFYFRDLIKQATASGTATFINSCNSQPIPSTVKTFIHNRPIIDWQHGTTGPSRTGTFSTTGAATTINIGAAGSPVSGPQFGGNCAIGGIFYPYDDFPAGYKNTFIFADYTKHWIRNIATDATDKPSSVSNVIDTGAIVALAIHPTQTGIYFIDFTSTIKKIVYNSSNRPPVAVASSDKTYGTGPLTVQFTGSGSSDPDGQRLTYLWDFGDGKTDTLANPSHIFSPPTSTSTKYTVTLTVTDTQGSTAQAPVTIYVNNTPPQVIITSPANGSFYPITSQATFQLRAAVSDREDSVSRLSFQWQVILHHEDHEHPEPVITTQDATATTEPLGCGIETYYYRILLTVSDLAGQSTTKEVRMYPYCGKVETYTLVNAETDQDIQPLTSGAVLDSRTLPRKINIRANTNPPAVGSVIFNLTGGQTKNRTDNIVPYALFGDTNGDYAGWNATAGSYTLKGTAYSGSGGGGIMGAPLTITFQIAKTTAVASAAQLETDTQLKEINRSDFSVNYYPNPFKQQFTLQIRKKGENKLPVKLYDVYGRVVFRLDDVQSYQTIVLGKDLAAGVYILTVSTGNKVEYYKLVKVR